MSCVEANFTVGASIETVWNCLNDIAHLSSWMSGLTNAEVITRGKYGKGSAHVQHSRNSLLPSTTTWTITAFEPFARQVHVSQSSALPATLTINVKRVATGTQIQISLDYQFLPMLGSVSRGLERLVMDKRMKQALKQNLASFNTYLMYYFLSNQRADKPAARVAIRRSTGVTAQAAIG